MTEPLARVGEVVESSTTGFTSQCYELFCLPPLGSLVKTQNSTVEFYAVVYYAATTGFEPGRHPLARGKDAASAEAIYQDNPQLQKLLKSEFQALVIGHKAGDILCHYLPPQPARIHSFVHLCPPEEVKQFSQSLNFLDILLNSKLPLPSEELIAACLRQMAAAQADRHAFLVGAGKELAALLSEDYSRLKAILGRLK